MFATYPYFILHTHSNFCPSIYRLLKSYDVKCTQGFPCQSASWKWLFHYLFILHGFLYTSINFKSEEHTSNQWLFFYYILFFLEGGCKKCVFMCVYVNVSTITLSVRGVLMVQQFYFLDYLTTFAHNCKLLAWITEPKNILLSIHFMVSSLFHLVFHFCKNTARLFLNIFW